MAERLNGIQEVRGSTPLGSTIHFPPYWAYSSEVDRSHTPDRVGGLGGDTTPQLHPREASAPRASGESAQGFDSPRLHHHSGVGRKTQAFPARVCQSGTQAANIGRIGIEVPKKRRISAAFLRASLIARS